MKNFSFINISKEKFGASKTKSSLNKNKNLVSMVKVALIFLVWYMRVSFWNFGISIYLNCGISIVEIKIKILFSNNLFQITQEHGGEKEPQGNNKLL